MLLLLVNIFSCFGVMNKSRNKVFSFNSMRAFFKLYFFFLSCEIIFFTMFWATNLCLLLCLFSFQIAPISGLHVDKKRQNIFLRMYGVSESDEQLYLSTAHYYAFYLLVVPFHQLS